METVGFFFFGFTTLLALADPIGHPPPLRVALALQFVLNGVSSARIGFAG